MVDFRHYIDLITEAQHDALVDAIIRQFPDQKQEIQDHAAWASQTLKKADRINWYLGKLRAYLSDQLTPEVLGDYRFTTMQQLQHDLAHFYGFNDAAIAAYQYQRQPIGKLIQDLIELEAKWIKKQNNERGVNPQPGDYVLFEFAGGIKWWWIDRAHCSEEGRSGKHCGNVTGRTKTDQRILSLRNARNQVILTFILEPDGTLGEMKAKGNQKPNEFYHPHIMKLLLWDKITGISGMGYLPDMNFSVFDLNVDYLNELDQHKPKLISDQAGVTPFELLKINIPVNIKQKYLKYAEQKQPSIKRLINSNTYDQWYNEIINQEDLIFYLPSEYITKFPNYLDTLINQAKKRDNVLKIPRVVSRNFDYMKEIVAEIPRAIGLTNRYAKGYKELCEIAVTKDYDVMSLINEESRTIELYTHAVKANGLALRIVPRNIRLAYPELCKDAITHDGEALKHIPLKLRTEELCKIAVSKNPIAIKYTPPTLDAYDEIVDTALSYNGRVLTFIPEDLRTFNRSKTAVSSNGDALQYVPLKFRTPEICRIAINNGTIVLKYVPRELRTPALCEIAINKNYFQLRDVPTPLRTLAMCKSIIAKEPGLFDAVPTALKTVEMCKFAFKKYESIRNEPTTQLLHLVPFKILPEMIKFEMDKNTDGEDILRGIYYKYHTPEIVRLVVNYDRGALVAVSYDLRAEIEAELNNKSNQNESLYRILTLTKNLLKT